MKNYVSLLPENSEVKQWIPSQKCAWIPEKVSNLKPHNLIQAHAWKNSFSTFDHLELEVISTRSLKDFSEYIVSGHYVDSSNESQTLRLCGAFLTLVGDSTRYAKIRHTFELFDNIKQEELENNPVTIICTSTVPFTKGIRLFKATELIACSTLSVVEIIFEQDETKLPEKLSHILLPDEYGVYNIVPEI